MCIFLRYQTLGVEGDQENPEGKCLRWVVTAFIVAEHFCSCEPTRLWRKFKEESRRARYSDGSLICQ